MAIWSYMRGSDTLDIKVGYRCNNKCVHCVVDPVRQNIKGSNECEDLTTKEVLAKIDDAVEKGFNTVVLTGGEITIRKDFQDIVNYTVKKGLKAYIQTNARKLSQKSLCNFMTDLPGLLFIVALHAPVAETHDAITQEKGSFQETVEAISNLREINKEIALKIVISKLNHQQLFDTVLFAKELGVSECCIAFPHALDFPEEVFEQVVPRYDSLREQLNLIADFSEKDGLRVSFETIPYCICPDSEAFWRRNCDLLSKAWEYPSPEKNSSENTLFDWEELRPKMKTKGTECQKCVFTLLCEGPWREYVQNFGFTEFSPVKEDKVSLLLV